MVVRSGFSRSGREFLCRPRRRERLIARRRAERHIPARSRSCCRAGAARATPTRATFERARSANVRRDRVYEPRWMFAATIDANVHRRPAGNHGWTFAAIIDANVQRRPDHHRGWTFACTRCDCPPNRAAARSPRHGRRGRPPAGRQTTTQPPAWGSGRATVSFVMARLTSAPVPSLSSTMARRGPLGFE